MAYSTLNLINMLNIVIIGQNEGHFINDMLLSLIKYPFKRIWVLDRCTDASESKLRELQETYIKTNPKLTGRQTSYSRNLGLSLTDDDSDVLFLDGDRYLVTGNLNKLLNSKYDVELLYLENDFRTEVPAHANYGKALNGFFSCGLFIKREALEKIKAFQEGKVFNEEIQSLWGIEDTYLGDVCYHLGLTCNYNSTIRLNGSFSKTNIDSLEVLEKRFKLRDKLNVLW